MTCSKLFYLERISINSCELKQSCFPLIFHLIFIRMQCSDMVVIFVLSVVRGSIRNVSHDSARQTSLVDVSAVRVYRQRSGVFVQHEQTAASASSQTVPSWRGHINTLLQCQVKPGDGEFLFTGSEHFGEAWLGCAPRYKDFLSVYQTAWAARQNSCDFPLD